jgi:hypothetical protein
MILGGEIFRRFVFLHNNTKKLILRNSNVALEEGFERFK